VFLSQVAVARGPRALGTRNLSKRKKKPSRLKLQPTISEKKDLQKSTLTRGEVVREERGRGSLIDSRKLFHTKGGGASCLPRHDSHGARKKKKKGRWGRVMEHETLWVMHCAWEEIGCRT